MIVVGMSLVIVVNDLVAVFAGDIEFVRNIVIAAGENDLFRTVDLLFSADGEVAVGAGEAKHAFVLMDVEMVVISNAAIVFQGFGAAGLFVERRHGDIADFEKLGRSEKNQVDGVVVERVCDATLVEQYGLETALLQVNAAGKTRGTGAYNSYVKLFH